MGTEQNKNLEEEEERLKSLLIHLHTESGILDRIVYKGKNQHRRCPYFQALVKVRRDVRLLQSAGLGEILSSVFPIVDANKLAQKAHLPIRLKKKYPIGKHNYQERLLGVARLLSQMTEPILKAGIQISFLLAKSFFTGFSLTVLALLARLRVLVQQILLDAVSVFNKVSSLPQKKIPLKLTRGGIEAFRECYPSDKNVLTLECVWEKDKFVLFERTHKRDIKDQDVDRGALPSATLIKYETIKLFNEVESTEHELRLEIQTEFRTHDSRPIAVEPAINSSAAESESCSVGINIVDCEDEKDSVARQGADSASEGNQSAVSDPETKLRKKKVAFIPVRVPRPSETVGPSKKKMKLDLLASDAMKADDPFLSLLLGGGTNSTLF